MGTIFYFTTDKFNRVNYTGAWVEGEREGNGTTSFKDGATYQGGYQQVGLIFVLMCLHSLIRGWSMDLASSAILMETLWMLSLLQARSRDMEFLGELATFVIHISVIKYCNVN